MSTFTSLRVLLPTDLRVAAEERATAEGRSVADVVVELLGSYAKPKPRKKAAKKT